MYYPKSHITPNQYSNGELTIKGSNKPYIGYYFTTIDNQSFSGRYPEDGENLPLTLFTSFSSEAFQDEVFEDTRFSTQDNKIFSQLNDISNSTNLLLSPTPFYPQPSSEDYKLGEFTRYFSKKTNENKYTETSGLFQNSLYIGIQLPWLIAGDKNQAARVNENMVKLKEQELGIEGFGFYLKYNYLKFYK